MSAHAVPATLRPSAPPSTDRRRGTEPSERVARCTRCWPVAAHEAEAPGPLQGSVLVVVIVGVRLAGGVDNVFDEERLLLGLPVHERFCSLIAARGRARRVTEQRSREVLWSRPRSSQQRRSGVKVHDGGGPHAETGKGGLGSHRGQRELA